MKYITLFLLIQIIHSADVNRIEIKYDPHHFRPGEIHIEKGKITHIVGGQYNGTDKYIAEIPEPAYTRIISELVDESRLQLNDLYKVGGDVEITLTTTFNDNTKVVRVYKFKDNDERLSSRINFLYSNCLTLVHYHNK